MITFVTALFDIGRDKKGDGRTILEYLIWFKKTLQLNCNLFIVTEEKFIKFINRHRPKNYKTYIKNDILQNAYYYKYREQIKNIIESEQYKNKIRYPNRVECKIPEYNIIQYSKFGWLNDCIEINPFNSDYFFWIDAGISRFFYNVNLKNTYPSSNGLQIILNSDKKFIIQQRHDLQQFNIDKNFIWGADNLLKGGMFGGHKNIIKILSIILEKIFVKEMLEKNNVNNEQLALALLWKKYSNLFYIIKDDTSKPLTIFRSLSI